MPINTYLLFNNGLNDTFAANRSQILMMKPFPKLDEVFNLISREESQRNSGMQSHSFLEASAMAVNAPFRKKAISPVVCSYCGKSGHLKKSCFKIIGYPKKSPESRHFAGSVAMPDANPVSGAGLRNSVGHNVHHVAQNFGNLNLSQSQISRLYEILNTDVSDSPVAATVTTYQQDTHNTHNIVGKGITKPFITCASAFDSAISAYSPYTWIVDTGASNHIAYNLNLFRDYSRVDGQFVTLPDG